MKRNQIENKENLEANSSPLKKYKSTFKDFSGSPRTPNNLKSYVVKKEKSQKVIKKAKILKFLESVLHLDLQNTLLTDIVFSKDGGSLTVVGRTKLDGTSKQLNHVIPVSFIKNLIDITIKSSFSPKLSLKLLSKQLVILAQNQRGFAITSKQLEKEEYSEIKKVAPILSDRKLTTNTDSILLFSPGKKSQLFTTPNKKKIAKDLYPIHNKTFINKSMDLFSEAITSTDENTTTIACEALARFIFIICSKGKNISFASAGNTSRYEIRLYKDQNEAKKASDNYDVVKSRELIGLKVEEISKCIRIVNCEGSKIKETPKALDALNSIIYWFNAFDEIPEELVKTYNSKYNSVITLSNSTRDISDYNDPLTEENYDSIIYHHVAKLLYLAFDLKALEDIVFAPVFRGDVTVYPSAKGARTATYSLVEGDEYREMQLNSETGFKDDSFFRSREKDLKILPQKIVELFIIGTMPFATFVTGFLNSSKKFLPTCFEKLVALAATDYCLKDQELVDFKEATHDIYTSWISGDSILSDSQDTVISLSGDSDFSEFLE